MSVILEICKIHVGAQFTYRKNLRIRNLFGKWRHD